MVRKGEYHHAASKETFSENPVPVDKKRAALKPGKIALHCL